MRFDTKWHDDLEKLGNAVADALSSLDGETTLTREDAGYLTTGLINKWFTDQEQSRYLKEEV